MNYEENFESYKGYLKKNDYFDVPVDIAEKYIKTLTNHIRCVREVGKKLGVSDFQLIEHDNSKWGSSEFYGYAMHFQGGGATDLFAKAWLHHIHSNPHHWQYWMFSDGYTPENSDVENGIIEMPYKYTLEMVADWMGASRAYTGTDDMSDWLTKNMPKIKIHSKTANYLRDILDGLGYADIVFVQKFGSEL